MGGYHPELCGGFQSDVCPKLKPAVMVRAAVPAIWNSVNTRLYLKPIVGMIAGTIFWGATELPDQEERVRKGMFKANPARSRKGDGR